MPWLEPVVADCCPSAARCCVVFDLGWVVGGRALVQNLCSMFPAV
jgi:hypothetical protein